MHVRRLAATGLLVASCGLATAAASPALAVCDAYSTTCATGAPTPPPNNGGGGEVELPKDPQANRNGGGGSSVTSGGAGNGRTLPFTGGELVLLTSIGGAALVGGTALVLAGRRKSAPTA